MRKRKDQIPAMAIDPERTKLNLIRVEDETSESFSRSMEVIEWTSSMIRLASKRGRIKQEVEVCDEKEAA